MPPQAGGRSPEFAHSGQFNLLFQTLGTFHGDFTAHGSMSLGWRGPKVRRNMA